MTTRPEQGHDYSDHHEAHESAAHTALFTLLASAEQTPQTPQARAELLHQLQTFANEQLSWSPNIFNELSLNEQLDIATRFSRIPEAQGTVCQSFVGELTYNLQGLEMSSDDGSADYLTKYIDNLPIEHQLDTLSYLSTIGANAAAQGWADHLGDSLNQVADNVANNPYANPFLRYAAEATSTRLQQKQADPGGILIHQGDRSVGRTTTQSSTEVMDSSQKLRRLLKPDHNSSTVDTLNRISRDVVASFDQSHIPQAFTKFSKEAEHSHDVDPNAPDPEYVEHLAYLLNQEPTPHTIKQALDFTQAYLLPESTELTPADQLHAVSPNISRENWQNYLATKESLQKLRTLGYQYQQEQQANAEQKNELESQNFVVTARQLVTTLDQHRYQNIIAELANPSAERQYKAAEELALIGRYDSHAPAACHELSKLSDRVRRQHTKNFDLAQKKIELHFNTLNQQAHDLFISLKQQERSILTPETAEHLTTFNAKLSAESTAVLSHFTSLDTILADAGTDSQPGTVRLLEELNRPEMRARIETDMGIDLTDLTLREQVQLLTFLTHTSQADIDRTFSAIKTYSVSCARSFLSAEAGDSFRSHVLAISEQVDPKTAKEIFTHFAGLADLAQTTAHNLAQEFFVPGRERPFDVDAIQAQLLARARELLQTAAEQPTNSQKIVAQLARTSPDIALLATLYKSILRDDPDFSLENIKNIETNNIPATALSDNDRAVMAAISAKSWSHLSRSSQDYMAHDFNAKLNSPNATTKFMLVRNNQEILGFICSTPDSTHGPEAHNLESFNIDNPIKGAAIGDFLFTKALNQLKELGPVHLSADLADKITQQYVDKYGGSIERAEVFTDQEGVTKVWVHIIWNDRLPSSTADMVSPVTTIDLSQPLQTAEQINAMSKKHLVATSFSADPNHPSQRILTWIAEPVATSPHSLTASDTQTSADEKQRFAYRE